MIFSKVKIIYLGAYENTTDDTDLIYSNNLYDKENPACCYINQSMPKEWKIYRKYTISCDPMAYIKSLYEKQGFNNLFQNLSFTL